MNKKSAAVMNWRNRTKLRLIEYKGGKCNECGYNKKIPSCYDFHHKDPEQKDFGISGKSWSFERLKREVDKCNLLCKNCHSELHWELNQEARQLRATVRKTFIEFVEIECGFCGKVFKSKRRKYCSVKCARLAQRKVKRPTREQLKEELNTMTWVAIARRYGVSDNTIRKWAKGYDLIKAL